MRMSIEGGRRRRERVPRSDRGENGEPRIIEELPVPPAVAAEHTTEPAPEPIVPPPDSERDIEGREEPGDDEGDRQPTNETDPRPRPRDEEPPHPAPEPAPRSTELTRASPEQISATRAAVIGASGVAGGVVVGGATILGLGLAASYAAPMVISAAVASGTLAAGLAGLYVAGRLTVDATGALIDFAQGAVRSLIKRIDQMFSIFNKGL